MRKKIPVLKSHKETEAFLDQDLSDYLSAENLAPYRFKFKLKRRPRVTAARQPPQGGHAPARARR